MLPFVAGLALGATAVVAFSNKKEIKDAAEKGYEKTKEVAKDLKQTASSTVECVKEKMAKEQKPKTTTTKKTTPKTTTRKTTTKKTTSKATDDK